MKRKELIRHLEAHGCPLKREGGSHSIYWNPATGRREPVPRHSEIPTCWRGKSAGHWKSPSCEIWTGGDATRWQSEF